MAINPYSKLNNQFQYQPYDLRPMAIAGQEIQKREDRALQDLSTLHASGDGLKYLTDVEGEKIALKDKQLVTGIVGEFNKEADDFVGNIINTGGPIATRENIQKINELKQKKRAVDSQVEHFTKRQKAYEENRKNLQDTENPSWEGKLKMYNELSLTQQDPNYIMDQVDLGKAFDRQSAMKNAMTEIETFKNAAAGPSEDGYIRTGTREYREGTRIGQVFDLFAESSGLNKDIENEVKYKVAIGQIKPEDANLEFQKIHDRMKLQAIGTYETDKRTAGIKEQSGYADEMEANRRLRTSYSNIASTGLYTGEINLRGDLKGKFDKEGNYYEIESVPPSLNKSEIRKQLVKDGGYNYPGYEDVIYQQNLKDIQEQGYDLEFDKEGNVTGLRKTNFPELEAIRENNDWARDVTDKELLEIHKTAAENLTKSANKKYVPAEVYRQSATNRILSNDGWVGKSLVYVDDNGNKTDGTATSLSEALGYGSNAGEDFSKAMNEANVTGFTMVGDTPGAYIISVKDKAGSVKEVQIEADNEVKQIVAGTNIIAKSGVIPGKVKNPYNPAIEYDVKIKLDPILRTYNKTIDIYINGQLFKENVTTEYIAEQELEALKESNILGTNFTQTRKE